MATSINLVAAVSSDGTIEIALPQLPPGQRVHIVIEPEAPQQEAKRHAADILSEMQGHHLFPTAEEIDAYIKEERDSWDR